MLERINGLHGQLDRKLRLFLRYGIAAQRECNAARVFAQAQRGKMLPIRRRRRQHDKVIGCVPFIKLVLDGLTDWTDVTENSVRGSAWAGGLSHSFNYNAMQVGYSTLPSNNEEKKAVLIQLLAEHPEGIVLYDRRQPHAVLLTDYTDGVFYCSDPAGSVSSGRVPISAASISIAGASCYWYISSDHNSGVR